MPSQAECWYDHAVFYQIYVRAFRDSNADGHGDLRGVIEKLDYLQELGADCLWLMPTYPSPLKDDGYDISDYFGIHPDYGTLQDFQDLIAAAHARNLRVITDLVVNHTSDQHGWFIEARSSRESPRRDWYVWSDTDRKYQNARIIFVDIERSNWAYDAQSGQYYWHRFYSSQPDLNYDNPEVQQAMLEVMRFWLDKGIDGFRVDAVPYLFERDGTNCENLPETHHYVKRMRRYLDEHWPEAMILAEANQPPEDVRAYFGEGDEFHMAFNFPLMPRIFMALRLQQADLIREMWQRIPSIPSGSQWCTFLRNHDELTLEMVTNEERQLMWRLYAPEARMRLNLGIRRRLAPLLNDDVRKIMLANAILFSLPGTPIIYYGDEIGMGDNLDLPDRNGVRTPMQWHGGFNAGFSEAPADKLYSPVIDDPIYGYNQRNVTRQQSDPDSLFSQMRRLIGLRKSRNVFSKGSVRFLEVHNGGVLALTRSQDDQTFVILHNLSDREQSASVDSAEFAEGKPVSVMGAHIERNLGSGAEERADLTLQPYESLWLEVQRAG